MALIKKKKKITYLVTKRPLPNGDKVLLQMVKHPGAVLIVPFLSSNKIIMMRQFRAVLGKYLYELPAGTIDKGEKIDVCAYRELLEETGYRAKELKRLGKIFPVPGYSTEIIYIFRADKLMKEKTNREADEVIETFMINKSQVRQLFKQGKIHDAKTICGLAFCGWL